MRAQHQVSFMLFAALSIFSGSTTVDEKIVKEKLVSNGKTREHYLFVPSTARGMTPPPLIILLHGSGRNGLPLVEKWKDMAAREGIVLSGPDATDPKAWRAPADGPEFLKHLVESINAKIPLDTRRVYLFGHSAGAQFGIQMALLESEYFAAAVLHAGALSPEEYRLAEFAVRKIPMTFIVGTRDPLFPLSIVRATVGALSAKGLNTQLIEVEGHDHNYYARADQINRPAWEFLKQQKLEKDPSYREYRSQ